jgi:hypothetical protein
VIYAIYATSNTESIILCLKRVLLFAMDNWSVRLFFSVR